MSDKPRRLGQIQFHQLILWVDANFQELKEKQIQYSKAASWASTQLCFEVADSCLSRAVRDLDKVWLTTPPGGPAPRRALQELAEKVILVMQENQKLTADVAALRGCVGFLADKLGEKLPPGFGIPQKLLAPIVATPQRQTNTCIPAK